MNLVKLENLIAVMECGSYVAAGKKVNATPQAVAKAITKLEGDLGVKLVESTTSGTMPTPNAYALIDRITGLVQGLEDLRSHASSLVLEEGGSAGSLSIAVSSSPYEGEAISRKPFFAFREKHPEIDLSVDYKSSGSCIFSLQKGLVDALVVRGQYAGSGVSCSKLFDAPLCAVVSKGHPLARRREVSLAELAVYPIGPPYDSDFCRACVEEGFKEKGLTFAYGEPMVFMSEYDDFVHKRNGVGFVVFDPSMKDSYSDVVFLPLEADDAISIPICLMFREENRPLALLRRFLTKLR